MEADGNPNLDLMRRLYEAMRSGDVATLEEIHTPDFRLSVAGTSAISGDFAGVAGAGRQFQHSMELTAGQMEMEVRHLVADDRLGMARLTARARRPDGRAIVQELVHELEFSDGRISAMREWIWDQEADRRFWA